MEYHTLGWWSWYSTQLVLHPTNNYGGLRCDHLGWTEEQVTLPVVLDLGDRSLVTVHHDRLHDETSLSNLWNYSQHQVRRLSTGIIRIIPRYRELLLNVGITEGASHHIHMRRIFHFLQQQTLSELQHHNYWEIVAAAHRDRQSSISRNNIIIDRPHFSTGSLYFY